MEAEKDSTADNNPINILLAEDNEADVKIALRAFNNARFKNNLHVVSNGEEALDYLYRKGFYNDETKFPIPDLVILDLKMPKMDGFEVLRKIKEDPKYDFIPVVILTSSENEEDIIKGYRYGASSYIQKPVDYNEFTKIVDGFNFYWNVINKLPDQGKPEKGVDCG